MSGWLSPVFRVPCTREESGPVDGRRLIIGTYLNWQCVAPRLRTYSEQTNNSPTLSAYLEERFGGRRGNLRIVSATVAVVFFTLYVASGFVAGGLLLHLIFGVGF